MIITYCIFIFYLFTTVVLVRAVIKLRKKKRIVGNHYNILDDENNDINSFLVNETQNDLV